MLGINSRSKLEPLEFDSPFPSAKQVCQFCSNMCINHFSLQRLLAILNVGGLVDKYIIDILYKGRHPRAFTQLWGVSLYKAYKIRNCAITEIQLHWQEIKEEYEL